MKTPPHLELNNQEFLDYIENDCFKYFHSELQKNNKSFLFQPEYKEDLLLLDQYDLEENIFYDRKYKNELVNSISLCNSDKIKILHLEYDEFVNVLVLKGCALRIEILKREMCVYLYENEK